MKAPSFCLQLDVGNSSTKWRLVNNGQVLARGQYLPDDVSSRELLLGCCEKLDQIWVSSVAAEQAEQRLAHMLRQRWQLEPWFARTPMVTGELRNSYAEPSRMGVDRWLAMLGARARFKQRLCVVDAGSALTIDLIAASGQHQGGYIIPGPALMERALLLDTDRVRFDQDVDYGLSPGRSTAEAVRHGITLAQAGAVAMVVAQNSDHPMQLVFCGGGGEALMQLLGCGGAYLPDLVFEGLAVMASYAPDNRPGSTTR